MTFEELVKQEPYLHTKDDKIYLVPSGKYGWTSFPVGENVIEKQPRELPKGFVMPEELTDEEKENILFEDKSEFELFNAAVAVTVEEYEGLQAQTHRWKDGKIIKRVKSTNEIALEKAQQELQDATEAQKNARNELTNKDYIGRKISEALLLNDEKLLGSLREQYASDILAAQHLRETVNNTAVAIDELNTEIENLKEIIKNED